jgi:hypothetical protein
MHARGGKGRREMVVMVQSQECSRIKCGCGQTQPKHSHALELGLTDCHGSIFTTTISPFPSFQ